MLANDRRHEQDAFLNALRSYVELVLQTPLEIEQTIDGSSLPSFLSQRYTLIEARIRNHHCVLMVPHDSPEETPGTIAKHRDLLRRHFPPATIILATPRLSTHNRHRLIRHHVPFIVPGNQLFVPELAIDLREYFRSEPDTPPETLSPTAQLLVLAALLTGLHRETPSGLASRFHYSTMSMSRAIDELEALQLIEVEPSGKFRHVSFHLDRDELWRRTRAMLRSPVRKRRRIPRPPVELDIPLAGESALAERTDLSDPSIETRAIAASNWKTLANRYGLDRPVNWDEPVIELETWSYDPALLQGNGIVDPISLWLSLPDSTDERISAAKDMLLRQATL